MLVLVRLHPWSWRRCSCSKDEQLLIQLSPFSYVGFTFTFVSLQFRTTISCRWPFRVICLDKNLLTSLHIIAAHPSYRLLLTELSKKRQTHCITLTRTLDYDYSDRLKQWRTDPLMGFALQLSGKRSCSVFISCRILIADKFQCEVPRKYTADI